MEMWVVLRGKGLWRISSKQEKKHPSHADRQEEWNNKANKAFGLLTLGVE